MILDVTRWLPEHPGGDTIIPAQALNLDCSRFFEVYHASRESFVYLIGKGKQGGWHCGSVARCGTASGAADEGGQPAAARLPTHHPVCLALGGCWCRVLPR